VASNGVDPDMTLSIADYNQSFDVSSSSLSNYTYTTPVLPAGTYVVRTQLDNSGEQIVSGTPTAVAPTLTIGSLAVSSNATFKNTNSTSDTNALDAANTYISNFRQGPGTVATGFASSTRLKMTMMRNAFDFGGTVSGSGLGDSVDMLGVSNPAITTQQGQFQSFINQYFNTIVPSNAGKWSNNEASQNNVTMQLVDEQLNYAKTHNMDMRMHNLIWGSGATSGNQQPTFVNTLISSAVGGNATSKATLTTDITNRIAYYISGTSSSTSGSTHYGTGDIRATDFSQIDVLNEALNSPSYWNIFGNGSDPNGTAAIDTIDNIYHQVAVAAAAAGNPNLKLDTNEYNVLQFSPSSINSSGTESGSDPYANWYRNEVEAINNGAVKDFGSNSKVVNQIGIELYSDITGSNLPTASTLQQALQNLSVEGLPIAMNEFGMGSGTSSTDLNSKGPGVLDMALRMFYGNPLGNSFMNWGWWNTSGSTAPAQMIVTQNGAGNYTLTAFGQQWVTDMNAFTTPLQNLTVNSDGTINFGGFYGEYALKGTLNSNTSFTFAVVDFEKGPNDIPEETLWVKGDFNLDGKLTNADLQAMLSALRNPSAYQSSHDMSNEEFNAICDVNSDGVVDAKDIMTLEQLLVSGIQAGNGVFGGNSFAAVPEPASAILAAISFGMLLFGSRRRKMRPGSNTLVPTI
jgi:GH35 family endo-1,4-beta-xylanase